MRQETINYKFLQPWKVKIRKYKFSDFFIIPRVVVTTNFLLRDFVNK